MCTTRDHADVARRCRPWPVATSRRTGRGLTLGEAIARYVRTFPASARKQCERRRDAPKAPSARGRQPAGFPASLALMIVTRRRLCCAPSRTGIAYMVSPLRYWIDEHPHFAPEGASARLVHARSGKPVDPVLVDRRSGRPITGRDFVFAAGPTANERVRAKFARRL
jgi:hypothetical protein